MILYTVIIVSTYFIKPFIHGLMPNLPARITVTAITLLLMAPFLKAMIGWETILPIFVREKIAQFLCVFTHKDKKDEKRKSVISKIEEKLGICSIYDKAIG